MSKAWLLRWEWSGQHAALEDEIATILPSRWGRKRVEQAMWLLSSMREHSLTGLADVARNSANDVFKVQWHNGIAHLGGNPSLAAFQVDRLSVETDTATGLETVRYTMLTLYRKKVGSWPPEPEIVRGPLDMTCVRSRTGPLSSRRAGA